jgi:hypothetical protein
LYTLGKSTWFNYIQVSIVLKHYFINLDAV